MLTNRLTARALALGLQGVNVEEAARTLAAMAEGNVVALQRALARVRRGLATRPSPVGQRAADALVQARCAVRHEEAEVRPAAL